MGGWVGQLWVTLFELVGVGCPGCLGWLRQARWLVLVALFGLAGSGWLVLAGLVGMAGLGWRWVWLVLLLVG